MPYNCISLPLLSPPFSLSQGLCFFLAAQCLCQALLPACPSPSCTAGCVPLLPPTCAVLGELVPSHLHPPPHSASPTPPLTPALFHAGSSCTLPPAMSPAPSRRRQHQSSPTGAYSLGLPPSPTVPIPHTFPLAALLSCRGSRAAIASFSTTTKTSMQIKILQA